MVSFVAIHFSVNRTLVKMIFCAWCYCNWVFWKKKETIFTEMCKFVAELTVKMRTPNCFCILSGKQWCMRIYRVCWWRNIHGSPWTWLHGCTSEKWTANPGVLCCLSPGWGVCSRPDPDSFICCFFSFVRMKFGGEARHFASVRSFSKKQKAKPQKWAVGVRTPLGKWRRDWQPNSDFRVLIW